MRQGHSRDGFSCEACGSPAIALPSVLDDDAVIRCHGCGGTVGRWGSFKKRAQALIDSETKPCRRGPPTITLDTSHLVAPLSDGR